VIGYLEMEEERIPEEPLELFKYINRHIYAENQLDETEHEFCENWLEVLRNAPESTRYDIICGYLKLRECDSIRDADLKSMNKICGIEKFLRQKGLKI